MAVHSHTLKLVPSLARDRLEAMRGVTIIDNPAPHDPAAAAMIIAGVRCLEIQATDAGFSAALHVRFGEWLPLAQSVPEDVAFAAVAAFIEQVAGIPQHYSAENDAAERAA